MCITYTSQRVAESVYATPPLPEFRDKLSHYHKVITLIVPTTLLFVRIVMIQALPPLLHQSPPFLLSVQSVNIAMSL